MSENNNNYSEAILALKKEYEDRIALMEAECAVLKGELNEKKAKTSAAVSAEEAYLNEYVDVKLFRDADKYTDDVYVAINGQNCIIKRGEWVKIKRKFALVLDQSEIQDMRTSELIRNAQSSAPITVS